MRNGGGGEDSCDEMSPSVGREEELEKIERTYSSILPSFHHDDLLTQF
jgi:hypothetical protein